MYTFDCTYCFREGIFFSTICCYCFDPPLFVGLAVTSNFFIACGGSEVISVWKLLAVLLLIHLLVFHCW
jgi:hypothetical protein